ncbi:MAG TPA: DNA-binding protein [Candidatus Mediterraneibacter intestinigallinarum]|nr:DNA-binding protein [Candidatus Mediterraneibacter intestinigallinarum]
MAVKKSTGAAKTTAKTVKAEPVKAETKAVKAEPAKETAKAEPAKAAAKTVKAESAKAIETKKDTTKKLETKAGVLVDTPAAEEKKAATAKTAAKKTTAKKAAAKTTAAKKTAAKKTTATKKAAAKKAEIKTEMYLQFSGKEYSQEEILQKVKDIWTYDLHQNVDDIKDVQLYLKPEESAAYYVVNGVESGKVVL